MDSYDQLNTALIDAKKYPTNLLRSQSFKHDLLAFNDALRVDECRLFLDDPEYPEYSGVKLFESYDGGGKSDGEYDRTKALFAFTDNWEAGFGPLKRYRTVDELRSHFQAGRKDPQCRHV